MGTRLFTCSLAGLCLAAGCTRENPAFIEPSGGTGGSGPGATASSGTATASAGTTPDSTTADTAGMSTGSACALSATGERIDVSLTFNGAPVCPTNGNVTDRWFKPGSLLDPTRVNVFQCDSGDPADGCSGCSASPSVLKIEGPAAARPDFNNLPDCFRIALYTQDQTPGLPDCIYSNLILKKHDTNGVIYPFYVAGIQTADPPGQFQVFGQDLEILLDPDDTCTCDACCENEAHSYNLVFTLNGTVIATVPPGISKEVGPYSGDTTFAIHNVEARDDVACGERPEIYWSFGDIEFLGPDG